MATTCCRTRLDRFGVELHIRCTRFHLFLDIDVEHLFASSQSGEAHASFAASQKNRRQEKHHHGFNCPDLKAGSMPVPIHALSSSKNPRFRVRSRSVPGAFFPGWNTGLCLLGIDTPQNLRSPKRNTPAGIFFAYRRLNIFDDWHTTPKLKCLFGTQACLTGTARGGLRLSGNVPATRERRKRRVGGVVLLKPRTVPMVLFTLIVRVLHASSCSAPSVRRPDHAAA